MSKDKTCCLTFAELHEEYIAQEHVQKLLVPPMSRRTAHRFIHGLLEFLAPYAALDSSVEDLRRYQAHRSALEKTLRDHVNGTNLQSTVVGKCPDCGGDLREAKQTRSPRSQARGTGPATPHR